MKSDISVTVQGFFVFLVLTAVASSVSAVSSQSVTVSPEQQQRMGVEVQALSTISITEMVPAFIRAVDIGPLLMLFADLETVRAAVSMSASEYRRVSLLASQDQGASVQSLEAARAMAATDQAKLKLIERRLRIEWSPGIAAQANNAKAPLIDALTRGEAVLLRADSPQRPSGVVGEVAISVHSGSVPLLAEPLDLAGVADPRLQTVGLYALARGRAAATLRPGQFFSGSISVAEDLTGIVIPRDAMVRLDGASWVYVQIAADAFSRREIVDAWRIETGWFVTHGFVAGDNIATAGAFSLLALERADGSAEGN